MRNFKGKTQELSAGQEHQQRSGNLTKGIGNFKGKPGNFNLENREFQWKNLGILREKNWEFQAQNWGMSREKLGVFPQARAPAREWGIWGIWGIPGSGPTCAPALSGGSSGRAPRPRPAPAPRRWRPSWRAPRGPGPPVGKNRESQGIWEFGNSRGSGSPKKSPNSQDFRGFFGDYFGDFFVEFRDFFGNSGGFFDGFFWQIWGIFGGISLGILGFSRLSPWAGKILPTRVVIFVGILGLFWQFQGFFGGIF